MCAAFRPPRTSARLSLRHARPDPPPFPPTQPSPLTPPPAPALFARAALGLARRARSAARRRHRVGPRIFAPVARARRARARRRRARLVDAVLVVVVVVRPVRPRVVGAGSARRRPAPSSCRRRSSASSSSSPPRPRHRRRSSGCSGEHAFGESARRCARGDGARPPACHVSDAPRPRDARKPPPALSSPDHRARHTPHPLPPPPLPAKQSTNKARAHCIAFLRDAAKPRSGGCSARSRAAAGASSSSRDVGGESLRQATPAAAAPRSVLNCSFIWHTCAPRRAARAATTTATTKRERRGAGKGDGEGGEKGASARPAPPATLSSDARRPRPSLPRASAAAAARYLAQLAALQMSTDGCARRARTCRTLSERASERARGSARARASAPPRWPPRAARISRARAARLARARSLSPVPHSVANVSSCAGCRRSPRRRAPRAARCDVARVGRAARPRRSRAPATTKPVRPTLLLMPNVRRPRPAHGAGSRDSVGYV